MKINHILLLIGISALGILTLIAFQVIWMRYSRILVEEQFNNRVNMALCTAVEKVAGDSTSSAEMRACCSSGNLYDCAKSTVVLIEKTEMQTALKNALEFHQINLPYQPSVNERTPTAPFSCSLQPILANDSLQIQLAFQGKNEYLLERMGFMVVASIGILMFICAMFALASYYLLRQKRMSDQNRDFFNQLTHEFRTPLANIRLAGTMVGRKNPNIADSPYLEIIKNETDHLTHQVENVLLLANLEKGAYQIQKKPIDLKILAKEVVSSMDLQIRERSARVYIDEMESSFTIKGDAFHLRNAFRNLIENALKYCGEKPAIHIAFTSNAEGGHMLFSDNGKGLSTEEQKMVFQKFYRCNNATNSGEKGFGIGLSYVKKIMEMHSGNVSIQKGTEQGTCFDLYFPI